MLYSKLSTEICFALFGAIVFSTNFITINSANASTESEQSDLQNFNTQHSNSNVADDTDLEKQDQLTRHLTPDSSTQKKLTDKLIEKSYYVYNQSEVDSIDLISNSDVSSDIVSTNSETTILNDLNHSLTQIQNSNSRDIGEWVIPKQKNHLTTIDPMIKKELAKLLNSNIHSKTTHTTPFISETDNVQADSLKEANPTLETSTDQTSGFHALADYGYYDNKDYTELKGNVEVTQNNQKIAADTIRINLKDNTITAEGEVFFNDTNHSNVSGNSLKNTATEPNTINNLLTNPDQNNASSIGSSLNSSGLLGFADSITYDTNQHTATANDFAFASVGMQAHGYAKTMQKLNQHQYALTDVMFSTCPPTKLNWQLNAKNLAFDTESGRGESYNNTLSIRNVPVMYLPYFNFPINNKRSSGFLVPKMSLSTESGLVASAPYYLNLAPNYDATITPKLFTDRNPMLDTEFRYLHKDYGTGGLNVSFLAGDRKYDDQNRNSVFAYHDWQSQTIDNLSITAEYNRLSDIDFNNDFDYLGTADNNLNLSRSISTNYHNRFINAEFKVETFQKLTATDVYGNVIQDKDRPYARLPQLLVDYKLPKIKDLQDKYMATEGSIAAMLLDNKVLNNIDISGEHDSAYFKKSIDDNSDIEKSGFRMYNKVNMGYPIIRPWGYIKPNLSLQSIFSSYDKDTLTSGNISEQDGKQSVLVPQFSLDAMTTFSKEGAPSKFFTSEKGGYQLLSPRIKYNYAPYKQQNDIPNFNTRIASVNYDQLFADTWFLGHDRLQDLHAITPGLNYRYIDSTGTTKIEASIAQQFYLDKGNVTLADINNDTSANKLFANDSSGVVANFSLQPYDSVTVDTDFAFTHDYKPSYVTADLRYQANKNTQITLGIVERFDDKNTNQQALSAITGSAIFPINQKWRIIGQTQYDYDNNKFLESLVGVDYEDCCVGFSVYGRRYINDFDFKQDVNHAVMAEIRLEGLSDISSKMSNILSKKIINFNQIDAFWKEN